jgi:hypothetical protein
MRGKEQSVRVHTSSITGAELLGQIETRCRLSFASSAPRSPSVSAFMPESNPSHSPSLRTQRRALVAGDGSDRITGGRGEDEIDAGTGSDDVRARDQQVDDVACGGGRDTVAADRDDELARCEVIRRR